MKLYNSVHDDDDYDDDDNEDDDDDDTDNRGQLVTRPVLTNDRIRNGDACPDCTSHTIAGCTNHTIAVGGQLLHLLHCAVSFYTVAPTPTHTHTHKHTHTCYCTPWPYTLLLHHLHLHCTAFALPPSLIYANNTKCIECTWKGNMWINSVQTGEMQGGRGAIEGLGCNAVESQ